MNLTLDHDFILRRGPRKAKDILWSYKPLYWWDTNTWNIYRLLEEYKNRPVDKLFEPFEKDSYFLIDVLHVCDRRIGHRRLFLESFMFDGANPARKALRYRLKL